MIIVRVELHSAITRKVTEIARMKICNSGGSVERGNYYVAALRGRNAEQFDRGVTTREGDVKDYPRQSIHVWHLVARALVAMGYVGKGLRAEPADLFEAVATPEAGT
jgi:hypothetical protein